MRSLCSLFLSLSLFSSYALAAEQTKLAVMPFKAQGVEDRVATIMNSLIVIEVDGLKDFERGTIVNSSTYATALEARLAHLREVNAVETQPRQRLRDCTGHVTVTSQRVQDGDFNRRLFTVFDECGQVVSVTRSRPDVQINR